MKRHLITSLTMLAVVLFFTSAHANAPRPDEVSSDPRHTSSVDDEGVEPLFIVRVCVNFLFVSACVEFDCDLSVYDLVLPGVGQLMGHSGCTPVGHMANPNGGPEITFHTSEEMLQGYETLTNAPPGSIKFLEVLQSPTFPWPDGKEYRVVAKRYSVLKDANGRYVPFEVEAVSR